MKSRFLFLSLSLILFSSLAGAAKVGGVSLPQTLTAGDQTLALNGAGIRKKLFIKLYASALYLQEKSGVATAIIDVDAPMAIRLSIISSLINSKKMEKATHEGFENSTHGNTKPVQKEIKQFIRVFHKPVSTGDVYDLLYTPAKGTEVLKNNKLITTIEGLAFKKALFGIWLSDHPAQDSLKDAMLGK
jgi:hypothetical protein